MTARYLRADPGDARHTFWLHPDEPGKITPAELDALRKHIAQLPNPAVYAEWLACADPHAAQLLVNPTTCVRGSSAADQRIAAALRPYGLCEMRGTGITAFGSAVRRRLLELDQ